MVAKAINDEYFKVFFRLEDVTPCRVGLLCYHPKPFARAFILKNKIEGLYNDNERDQSMNLFSNYLQILEEQLIQLHIHLEY